MTLYIVDASVVAEYILTGPYTSYTQAFFRGALRGDLFTTPEWCLPECTNVIWKAVRFRGMPAFDAEWALKNLKALPLKRAATKSILSSALAIGLKHHLQFTTRFISPWPYELSIPLLPLTQNRQLRHLLRV